LGGHCQLCNNLRGIRELFPIICDSRACSSVTRICDIHDFTCRVKIVLKYGYKTDYG